MSWACNTYGLRSINVETFNGYTTNWTAKYGDPVGYSRDTWLMPVNVRNWINTIFRVSNLLFNVLGYFPETRKFSGPIRMLIGCSICVVTVAIGSPMAQRGVIVGRWYREALLTGVAQIFRGCMEASLSHGWVINGGLDIIGTISNIQTERSFDRSQPYARYYHEDPSYWLPFQFLRLV